MEPNLGGFQNLRGFLVPTRWRGNRFGTRQHPVFAGLWPHDVFTTRMRSNKGALIVIHKYLNI